jgi:hypothetical protein
MKDPDEHLDGFELEVFEDALRKLPPEDLDRVQQEVLNEMHAEAMMGVATPMWLPPDVLERIYTYAEKWSIDRNKLIPLAIISTKGREEEVVEIMDRYLKDPPSFEWPIEDPLLCVSIACMQACANWMTKKINQEYGNEDEDGQEPADWWKVGNL